MANWIELYYDELRYEETLEKIGEAFAAGIRDTMGRPGSARIVLPAVPVAVVPGNFKGSMPIKSIRFMGQDVDDG